jgi:hypothetical protein
MADAESSLHGSDPPMLQLDTLVSVQSISVVQQLDVEVLKRTLEWIVSRLPPVEVPVSSEAAAAAKPQVDTQILHSALQELKERQVGASENLARLRSACGM